MARTIDAESLAQILAALMLVAIAVLAAFFWLSGSVMREEGKWVEDREKRARG